MTKREMTKKIARLIVGTSVGYSVSNALYNNTNKDNTLRKAEAAVAGFAVGSMVAEASESWTNEVVDNVFDAIDEFKRAH